VEERSILKRISVIALSLLAMVALLMTTGVVFAQDSWVPYIPHPNEVELSYWSVKKIAYVNVTITVSTPCFQFDWGTVWQDDRQFLVNSRIWQYTGYCIQVVTTFGHTYELGKLKYGKTYTFTFTAWGSPIKSITFKHLPPKAAFH